MITQGYRVGDNVSARWFTVSIYALLKQRLACWGRVALLALTTMFGVSSPAQTVTYIHNDPFGSPVMATDATGNVVWKETYKPYGERVNNSPAAVDNSIGFTGKSFDPSTGLSYMGARYYDPVLGRFLGVDPKEVDPGNVHGFNRYTYANNNPYKFVDPDGRQAALFFEAGVSALFAGSAYYAIQSPERQQAMRMSLGRAWDHILHADSNSNESAQPGQNEANGEKPSLLDPQGEQHILDGDGPNAGGGHRHGTGKSGKSEFPANWSDDKIKGEVSDVATDPGSARATQPNGRTKVQGTRDGVDITVVVEPNSRGGRIVTGFPTNTPRNP
jgi:RHS repeat-associated protein